MNNAEGVLMVIGELRTMASENENQVKILAQEIRRLNSRIEELEVQLASKPQEVNERL